MKFLEFISAVNLFEAAKDRYMQMFTNLQPMFDALNALDPKRFQEKRFNKALQEEMEWAMRVLKKQDKVIWYLRFVKIWLLRHLAQEADILDDSVQPSHDKFKPLMNNFKQAYNKAISQLAKKMGVSEDSLLGEVEDAMGGRFKRQIEHFLSLNIRALDEYVFSNQAPRQVLADWTPIEDIWKNKRKHTVPLDREGVDTIIKYPDGSEWVNLNKEYCEVEGLAMGHCGNAADPKEGDTVLSYRTIEEEEGEQLWKPQLTFILDRNGLLGETKARFNERPNREEHHDVIVDLLRQDFVKGIKGGGHEPENNFHFEDLTQELQDELVEEKPGLASIAYDYKKRGMTRQLINRMEGLWEDTGAWFPQYNESTGNFVHDARETFEKFVYRYGGSQAEWAMKILTGEDHLDIHFDGAPIGDMWDALPTNVQHQVGQWLIDEHSDLVEEWKEENDQHFDGTDTSATFDIVNENNLDEVENALTWGIFTGHEYGTEAEISESVSSWARDLPNGHDLELGGLHPGNDGSDVDQKILIPEETMIDIVSNHLDAVTEAGDFEVYLDLKELESPYNGWDGYDEEAAKERTIELLIDHGVTER